MGRRVGMMGSGSLTTIGASYRGIVEGRVPGIELGCVIVSNERALANAKAFGIPEAQTYLIRLKEFSSKDQFGHAINNVFEQTDTDFFAQLGWVPYTPANVLVERDGFNQHPAPVDPGHLDFGGSGMNNRAPHMARLIFCRRVHQRDPERDIMWTEMTTQQVDNVADMGDIILTERVTIEDNDDPISMQERMKPVEHELVMRTMAKFASGTPNPYKRPDRLVLLGDEFDYWLARTTAITAFPKG